MNEKETVIEPPFTDYRLLTINNHFVGWKLDAAREALAQDESTRALPVHVIETAPPPPKKQVEAQSRTFGSRTFGDWRVLRCRITNGEIELTVARELLTEERRLT